MQGGQSMEEAGLRARPRSTGAEFHKECSLLGPSRPDLRQLCHQVKSLLSARPALPITLGSPRPEAPPAARLQPTALALQHPPGRQLRLLRPSISSDSGDPRATPLIYPHARPGPPTALPGGGCRSPSAIFPVRSRSGCSRFLLTVHPAPLPGSTKLLAGK